MPVLLCVLVVFMIICVWNKNSGVYMEIFEITDIDKIVNLLRNGGLISLPTDTIYGFSCLATDNSAISRLCKMKNRDDGKQFILLVSKNFDLCKLLDLSAKNCEFIDKHTPANLTMIVNKNKDIQLADIFELPTLAVRIPDNDFLQSILDKVGFMVSTSCNLQGEPFINDYEGIMSVFPDIDAIVKFNPKPASPSTIVDLTSADITVVRQGEYFIK